MKDFDAYQCGIDEAGRGALAGPVSASAVILGASFPYSIAQRLADSKQLTALVRTELEQLIKDHAAQWAVAFATPVEIDELNVLGATLRAMERAFALLLDRSLASTTHSIARGGSAIYTTSEVTAIVDGQHLPQLPCVSRAIVAADKSIPEVQAASILAKTARDRWMINYARQDNRYAFEQHKGYPTRLHRHRLAQYGLSDIHRRSFSWRT